MVTSSYSPTGTSAPGSKRQGTRATADKKNNALPMILFAVIALLCASAGFRFMHGTAKPSTVKVVVAATALPAGVSIDFAQLRFLDVPKEYVSKDMTTSLLDVVGHESRTYIAASEPIRRDMVFPAMGGLSRNLASNERAITLQLNDDTLVDHSIRPDDFVDVLVVSRSKNSIDYTKTIYQSARVLLAAPKEQILAKRLDATMLNKVTIAVSPEMAETITEAAETGKIRLVLRARTSHDQVLLAGADPDDLLPHSAFYQAHSDSSVPSIDAAPSADGSAAPGMVPPAPTSMALPAPPAIADPIEWLVQVFSGAKKETVSVGQK